jgi:hypothetical protein
MISAAKFLKKKLNPKSQSPESQSHFPQQQQQPLPVCPWSARRLNLLPPNFLGERASPSPFPRYDHALPATATAAGELFLFGGLVHDSLRNDFYVFSTRDLSATLLGTGGEVPSPRTGHAGARIGNTLLIWGGATNISDRFRPIGPQDDSLYLLDFGTLDLLMSRLTLADYNFSRFRIATVDPRRGQWSRTRRSSQPCCDGGRFQALRLRWL